MREADYDHTVPRRSEGTRTTLRPAQPWPEGRPFKLLSIDGGGIRGLLPALVLAEIEQRYLGGEPIGRHFDMIAGTSTGGIIALGLGHGLSAREIAAFYIERGDRVFPPGNWITRPLRSALGWVGITHNRRILEAELRRILGHETFGNSQVPLCIPAFEGRYGEPYVYKTPHHPDYKRDGRERMVDVGVATAAAPTVYRAVERDGYALLDGGIWANNPVMVGVVDALSCFAIERRQLHVLSLGTGRERFRVGRWARVGGKLLWAGPFVSAAMAAQSHNALGQAGLLLGRDRITRIDGPETAELVDLTEVRRAVKELPGIARTLVEGMGKQVADQFLTGNQRETARLSRPG